MALKKTKLSKAVIMNPPLAVRSVLAMGANVPLFGDRPVDQAIARAQAFFKEEQPLLWKTARRRI